MKSKIDTSKRILGFFFFCGSCHRGALPQLIFDPQILFSSKGARLHPHIGRHEAQRHKKSTCQNRVIIAFFSLLRSSHRPSSPTHTLQPFISQHNEIPMESPDAISDVVTEFSSRSVTPNSFKPINGHLVPLKTKHEVQTLTETGIGVQEPGGGSC